MEIEAKVQKIWKYISNNQIISAVIVVLIGLIVTELIAYMSSPEAKLTKAEKLLDKADKERAETLLTQIFVDHRGNEVVYHKALIDQAGIYISEENFDRAIKDAEDAIKLNDRNSDAYYVLGRAYSLKGDHLNALQNFNEALELKTKRKADCYLYRGIDYYV
jgi:tetratricopeptide (TPR) repeat protein